MTQKLTLKQAKTVLSMLEQTPFNRLTAIQKDLFRRCTQVVRTHRKPATNPTPRGRKANPGAVIIYRRVLRVEAQKIGKHRCDGECRRANHCYFHDFSKGANAVAYGLPDGSVLIKGTKRLWGMF